MPLGQMFNIDVGVSNSSPCARVAGTLPSPQANDRVRYVGCQYFFSSMMMGKEQKMKRIESLSLLFRSRVASALGNDTYFSEVYLH